MKTHASPIERDPPLAALLRLVAAEEGQASGRIELDQAGWRTLVREAFRHGVAPLAWTRLRDASARESIPPWALHDLQRSYFQAGLDNLRRYGKLAPLLRRFAADGIDTLVLKGAFLADVVYRERARRWMSDVDLLVRREDLARTVALLSALGWSQTANDAMHPDTAIGHQLPTFVQDGVRIEVHWHIEDEDSPFLIDLEGLWRRAQPVPIAGAPALALAAEDLLLHLCLHTSHSHGWLQFSGGLRHLCDIAAVIGHYRSGLDWQVCATRADAWGIGNCAWLTLQLARDLVGAAVPETVLAQLAPRAIDARLVEAARDLALSAHYTRLVDVVPALAQAWLTKRWRKLSPLARWGSFLLPERQALAAAYPSLRPPALMPLRYLVYWFDVARDCTRVVLMRAARGLVVSERERWKLASWLESRDDARPSAGAESVTPQDVALKPTS